MSFFTQIPSLLTEQAENAKLADVVVESFMETNPIKLLPDTSIANAIQTFATHKISGAPIVNTGGKLMGMISEYDLLLQAGSKDLNSQIQYKDKIIGLLPTDTLKTALILLFKNRIRRLPVVDNTGLLLGMISRIDILKKIIFSVREHNESKESLDPTS